jgi:hypothetical protein
LFPQQISDVHPLLTWIQLIVSIGNAEVLRYGVELIEVESAISILDLRVKPFVEGVVPGVFFPFCPLIWCDLHCALQPQPKTSFKADSSKKSIGRQPLLRFRHALIAFQQFLHIDAEGGGDLVEHEDAEVLLAVFDLRQIGPVDLGTESQLLLREALSLPQSPNIRADDGAQIHAPASLAIANICLLAIAYKTAISTWICFFGGRKMASVFIATAFFVGFAWKMVAYATAFALLTYFIVKIVWADERKSLARGAPWAVWFAVLAYHLFPIAFVKAHSLSSAYWQAAILGGFLVLAMAGLCFLMIRSNRGWLRAASVIATLVVIALIGYLPFGGQSAAQVDKARMYASTALYMLARKGDVDRIRELVRQGAEMDSSFMMLQPLYGAVLARQLDAARVLLDLGADVNSTNGPAQRSPLHQAVLHGNIPMIQLLLSRGASVAAMTTHGRTPLEYAVNPPAPLSKPENGEEIAAILRKAGAK